VTVTVQIIMSCVEIAFLLLFAGLALFNAHHVTDFSWHWFSPSVFGDKGSRGFVAGALLAAFYYWGWDVTANLTEETKDAKRTAGIGGLLGAFVVFMLFEVFTVATNMVLTPAQLTNEDNAADILQVLGQAVWPGWGGKLIVVGVLLSTVATLETTLIQVTRTLFSMGRDHTLPAALGKTHPTRKSPIVATMTIAVISLFLFVGSQYIGSIATIMSSGYSAIGLQICLYYCLAGLSVVVLYRRQLFKSVTNFIFMGLWPLLGAVFMAFVFVKVIPKLDATTLWIGLGAIGLGLIPMAYYWAKGAKYYDLPSKEDRHAVLEEFVQDL
jgi:amino acid transporter